MLCGDCCERCGIQCGVVIVLCQSIQFYVVLLTSRTFCDW